MIHNDTEEDDPRFNFDVDDDNVVDVAIDDDVDVAIDDVVDVAIDDAVDVENV